MEVSEILHMTKGDGENSYSRTSTHTQMIALLTRPVIDNSVKRMLDEPFFPCKLLNVADLGCAAGPSTFTFMSAVIQSVEGSCIGSRSSTLPEIQLYLNDLPGNDFNTLFKSLSEFRKHHDGLLFYVMGAPGSFHERIFARNFLHLVHSSYSVHWLSRAPKLTTDEGLPLNKGKIYISKTSPPGVKEAYLAQFTEDLTSFLRCRNEEMFVGARLVLVLHGRGSADPASKENCFAWELLAEAISSMVLEGLVEEEKLDTLNIPYYTASEEEVRHIVQTEGSFSVEHIDTIALELGGDTDEDPWTKGMKSAKHMRSFTGSIVQHHLGEAVMDKLYGEKLGGLIGKYMSEGQIPVISIVLVLRKLDVSRYK